MDTYAYVADYDFGMQVIDVSNPTFPRIVGSIDTPGLTRDVAVTGDYAYLADDHSGLQVVDVADPSYPQIVGSVDTPGIAWGVAIAGNDRVYIADGESGLQVIDVSNPTSPELVGSTDTCCDAYGVTSAGTWAYVGGGFGLLLVDVSDPASPQVVASMGGHRSGAHHAAVTDAYAYIAAGDAGFEIAPAQCALPAGVTSRERHLPLTLLPPSPNPARTETEIRWHLPRIGATRLEVFDLTGRRVSLLLDGRLPAGVHCIAWDGCDDSRHEVASGVYLIRLTRDACSEATRLIWLR
jgi:hypothetical protein